MTTRAGTVYLVGAGPGDPKLLTIRGKECLEQADVVLYDYLANEALLQHVSPTAERLYVAGAASIAIRRRSIGCGSITLKRGGGWSV